MRSRIIKHDFFKDEDLSTLPAHTRLLYIGLWCMADKAGRLEDRPGRIQAEIFPYDKGPEETTHGLEALTLPKKSTKRPFIHRYTVDGEAYIQIVRWREHQPVHHTEKESKIPPYPRATAPAGSPATEEPKRKAFVPPTKQQVLEYAKEIGYRIDAEKFIAAYEQKGWLVGKTPMRDWKAAVRNWKANGWGSRGVDWDAIAAEKKRKADEAFAKDFADRPDLVAKSMGIPEEAAKDFIAKLNKVGKIPEPKKPGSSTVTEARPF